MDGQEQVSEPPQRYIVQLLRALLSVVSVSSFVSRFGLVRQFISVWRGGSAALGGAVQCLGALSPMRAQGTPLLVYCCLLLAGHTVFTAQCSAGRTNTTSSYSSCYAHWNEINNLCMEIKVSLTFFQQT